LDALMILELPAASRILRFSLHGYPHPRHLHSFPTRRSSDLPTLAVKLSPNCSPGSPNNMGRCNCPAGMRSVGPSGTAHCEDDPEDRKSTRLNSSHLVISYAVFCLKKKKGQTTRRTSSDRAPA